MKGINFAESFLEERCARCGECFHHCPVMHLPVERAKEEIERLIRGEKTKEVLQRCTSCHSCNIICPEQANPADLILQRWYELFQKEGMPSWERYFTPHSPKNFRTYILERLPDDEKKLVQSWDDDSPAEEIMYPGCNVITVPYLTMTRLFEGIPIRGSLDLCCGEMYFRTGHFDQLRTVAKNLTQHFRRMGLKRMYIPCTAGRNLFLNILPSHGADFDFEIIHILPWLYEKIESGDLTITHPLNMTITIHDSCHAKAFGDEYMDIPRKLLERIGATVIEQKYIRDMKLCCGIGGGFSHYSGYHPLKITRSTWSALSSLHGPKADAGAVYCAGCLQLLSVGQIIDPLHSRPIYHIIELIQMATGENPERRIESRARQLLAGVVRNQALKILSPFRYKMNGLSEFTRKE